MRFWPRRKSTTAPRPRPDRYRIAVLEHTELGITPQPGTPEAHAVAMATPVNQDVCPHDEVVETTELNHVRNEGMCVRCGADMVETDEGDWRRP